MKKLVLVATALLVISAFTMMFRTGQGVKASSITSESANNAAYRDGLQLGKLAAGRGNKPPAPMGRWTRTEDRASFAAGYDQGYNAALAQQTKEVKQTER